MVTKEQALTANAFIQVYIQSEYGAILKQTDGSLAYIRATKPIAWRRNGKTKTWKTRPTEFSIPIKHGLYNHAYITQDNAHLFDVA